MVSARVGVGEGPPRDWGSLRRSPPEPLRQCPLVGGERLAVGGPWLAIHARGCGVLEAVGDLPPSGEDVAMRPQRCQPHRALLCGLPSPGKRTGPGRPARRPAPGGRARVARGPGPARPDLRRGCLGRLVRHRSWWPVCGRVSSTLALSDALRPCVPVVSWRFPVRAWRRWARSATGAPGARTRCCRACQGAATPPGAGPSCRSGRPAVACRVCGARRPPAGPLRGSRPCRHVPLSTLHGRRSHRARLTRGQRGWRHLRGQRLALCHIVLVCPGTPERWR